MKLLEKTSLILFVFILQLCLSQCNSTKNTMDMTETIDSSKGLNSVIYYQNWVAGIEGGGSGTDLYINKELVAGKELKTAYFKGRIVDFDSSVNQSNFFIARYKGNTNWKKDKNMDADTIKEYGNEAPVDASEFPFNLASNEAMVSYYENGIIKYLKLTNITKKASLAYPSMPK